MLSVPERRRKREEREASNEEACPRHQSVMGLISVIRALQITVFLPGRSASLPPSALSAATPLRLVFRHASSSTAASRSMLAARRAPAARFPLINPCSIAQARVELFFLSPLLRTLGRLTPLRGVLRLGGRQRRSYVAALSC